MELENIEKIINAIKERKGEIPLVWSHGHTRWKFSKDVNCYVDQSFRMPPVAYCFGDRYIHCDYGLDSYGILFRGSTTNDWHGFDFGYDLKSAIEWVKEANYKDLQWYLWSGLK